MLSKIHFEELTVRKPGVGQNIEVISTRSIALAGHVDPGNVVRGLVRPRASGYSWRLDRLGIHEPGRSHQPRGSALSRRRVFSRTRPQGRLQDRKPESAPCRCTARLSRGRIAAGVFGARFFDQVDRIADRQEPFPAGRVPRKPVCTHRSDVWARRRRRWHGGRVAGQSRSVANDEGRRPGLRSRHRRQ